MINLIVAHDLMGAIGKENKLLCKLKDDMLIFKTLTQSKVVVMGRKTFESIGKALPNRLNVVLTRDGFDTDQPVIQTDNIEAILAIGRVFEVYVIGGEEIYNLFLPHADRLMITLIDYVFDDTDAFFPFVDLWGWGVLCQHKQNQNEDNEHRFTFTVYGRPGEQEI